MAFHIFVIYYPFIIFFNLIYLFFLETLFDLGGSRCRGTHSGPGRLSQTIDGTGLGIDPR